MTGRPIVGPGIQGLPPELQKTPWTSETMQVIGKQLDISPKRLETAVRSYFATFGMFLLGISDVFVHHLAGFQSSPALRVDEYPLIGRFIRSMPAAHTKYQTYYYDALHEVDEAVRGVAEYRATGGKAAAKAYFETLPQRVQKLYRGRRSVYAIRDKMSFLNRRIRRIMKSRLTSEKKRAKLNAIQEEKNRLTYLFYRQRHTSKAE